MSKTLGQVAFEAWASLRHYNYIQEHGTKGIFKDWERQDELRREEWQAAAEAVRAEVERRQR